MAYKIKRRCIRCLTVLREDGTCPNSECVKYVEVKKEENTTEANNTK